MESKKKYLIRTFGCQMNQHDSQFVAGLLDREGYTRTEETGDADVVIVNTCTVRENATKKICGFVDSLKPYKRADRHLRVVVVGCLVSDRALVDELLDKRPHIDLVLGTRSLDKLPHYLRLLETQKGPILDIGLEQTIAEDREHSREDQYRAYLTITYGCDNYCSYCIVPYVRGRESSRRLRDIVSEAHDLVADGVKEITLLGQNVNSYGKGLDDKENFADLLRALQEVDGLARIRYMTSHPKDFSDKIMDAIAACDKVCHHFHLPVQAGSNRILKQMNRRYTREYYLAMVEKIQARFPDATLTTDIIVGFPGESETDFADTLDLIRQVEYDSAYTFLYSPRHGTPAAAMAEQVRESVKKDRLLRLMAVQNEISLKKNQALVGQTLLLLGEGQSRTNERMQSGRTDGNKLVHFESDRDYAGEFLPVTITEAHTWSMQGRI